MSGAGARGDGSVDLPPLGEADDPPHDFQEAERHRSRKGDNPGRAIYIHSLECWITTTTRRNSSDAVLARILLDAEGFVEGIAREWWQYEQEDLWQEGRLAVVRALRRFGLTRASVEPDAWRAYARQAVRNAYCTYHRPYQRSVRTEEPHGEEAALGLENLAATEEAEVNEDSTFWTTVEAVPNWQLVELQSRGYTDREVSALVGIKPGALNMRRYRARLRLADALHEAGHDVPAKISKRTKSGGFRRRTPVRKEWDKDIPKIPAWAMTLLRLGRTDGADTGYGELRQVVRTFAHYGVPLGLLMDELNDRRNLGATWFHRQPDTREAERKVKRMYSYAQGNPLHR